MPELPTDAVVPNGRDAEQADGALLLLRLAEELTRDITPEQWAEMNIPHDAASQHKHYLYGFPKRPPLRYR